MRKIKRLIEYLRGRIEDARLPEDVDDAILYAKQLDILIKAQKILKEYYDDTE